MADRIIERAMYRGYDLTIRSTGKPWHRKYAEIYKDGVKIHTTEAFSDRTAACNDAAEYIDLLETHFITRRD